MRRSGACQRRYWILMRREGKFPEPDVQGGSVLRASEWAGGMWAKWNAIRPLGALMRWGRAPRCCPGGRPDGTRRCRGGRLASEPRVQASLGRRHPQPLYLSGSLYIPLCQYTRLPPHRCRPNSLPRVRPLKRTKFGWTRRTRPKGAVEIRRMESCTNRDVKVAMRGRRRKRRRKRASRRRMRRIATGLVTGWTPRTRWTGRPGSGKAQSRG